MDFIFAVGFLILVLYNLRLIVLFKTVDTVKKIEAKLKTKKPKFYEKCCVQNKKLNKFRDRANKQLIEILGPEPLAEQIEGEDPEGKKQAKDHNKPNIVSGDFDTIIDEFSILLENPGPEKKDSERGKENGKEEEIEAEREKKEEEVDKEKKEKEQKLSRSKTGVVRDSLGIKQSKFETSRLVTDMEATTKTVKLECLVSKTLEDEPLANNNFEE